jgi:formate dehydrogenase major subunit
MELSRRDFLRLSGTATAGGLLICKALDLKTASADSSIVVDLHKPIGEGYTICPYDGSGCGFLVAAEEGEDGKKRVVNIEGDPAHPVNRGAACAKGASMRQLSADNPRRLAKPKYRAAGSPDWEEVEWDWALGEIAKKVKATRDGNWIATEKVGDKDFVVNRTEAIACLGGAALDNEECYLLSKMMRGLGLVYLEHQARI